MTAAPYLASLNEAQRCAVEHGVVAAGANVARAAAGHRRRGLGQDQHARPPRRAPDRARRRPAAHPAAHLPPPGRRRDGAPGRSASSPRRWAMPAAQAPLLPGPAPSTPSARGCCASMRTRIGLDPAFTIHDRGDAADLMDMVRHELGLSEQGERFPLKAHVPGDLFARRQRRASRSTRCCASSSPGARSGRTSCSGCSPPTSRPSRRSTCSTTTTCCSTGPS